jgi:hypothetical protein
MDSSADDTSAAFTTAAEPPEAISMGGLSIEPPTMATRDLPPAAPYIPDPHPLPRAGPRPYTGQNNAVANKWPSEASLLPTTTHRRSLLPNFPIHFEPASDHQALSQFYKAPSSKNSTPITPGLERIYAGPGNPSTLFGEGWFNSCPHASDWYRCTICAFCDDHEYIEMPVWSVTQSVYVPHLSSKFMKVRATPPTKMHSWVSNFYMKPPNSSLIQAKDLDTKDAVFCVLLEGHSFIMNIQDLHGQVTREVVIARLLHNLQERFLATGLFVSPLELAIQCHTGAPSASTPGGYQFRNLSPYHIFPYTILSGFRCHRFILFLKVTAFRPWFPPLILDYQFFKKQPRVPSGATTIRRGRWADQPPLIITQQFLANANLRGQQRQHLAKTRTLLLDAQGQLQEHYQHALGPPAGSTPPTTPYSATMADFPAIRKQKRKPVRPEPALPYTSMDIRADSPDVTFANEAPSPFAPAATSTPVASPAKPEPDGPSAPAESHKDPAYEEPPAKAGATPTAGPTTAMAATSPTAATRAGTANGPTHEEPPAKAGATPTVGPTAPTALPQIPPVAKVDSTGASASNVPYTNIYPSMPLL